jgi:menaquinone-dependent protoporphyrinogen oxidase
MSEIAAVEGYDVVILGSAIYMGNWLPEARRFVQEHGDALRGVPLYLFSSGPLGADAPLPYSEPDPLQQLVALTHAREHHIFSGKLDAGRLSLGERLLANVVHVPAGDFRDWDAVRSWAHGIAPALAAPVDSHHQA